MLIANYFCYHFFVIALVLNLPLAIVHRNDASLNILSAFLYHWLEANECDDLL